MSRLRAAELLDGIAQVELTEHHEYMEQHEGAIRAVMHLASEKPEWLPALRAACASAQKAEPYGGEFAGAWVISELQQQSDERVWLPGLRTLAVYGLIEKAGPSTRGGRRAYYRMSDRAGIELGLQQLDARAVSDELREPS